MVDQSITEPEHDRRVTSKKKTSKRGRAKKNKGGNSVLSREQRREIAAVAALGVAVLCLLSLFPAELFGSRSLEWFPSGNMVGVFGVTIRGILFSVVGVASVIVPVVVIFLALQLGGWMVPQGLCAWGSSFWNAFYRPYCYLDRDTVVSVLGLDRHDFRASSSGIAGGGRHGGHDDCVSCSLCNNFRVEPLRSVGRGVMAGGDVAGRTMKVVADRGREAAQALADQRESELANQVVLPVEGWSQSGQRRRTALKI